MKRTKTHRMREPSASATARILARELKCAMRSRFLRDSCSVHYTLNTNASRVDKRVSQTYIILVNVFVSFNCKVNCKIGADRSQKLHLISSNIAGSNNPSNNRVSFTDPDYLNDQLLAFLSNPQNMKR